MQKPEKLNDRSNTTARALLRAQIDGSSEMQNLFKTQPFSAAC
jgi:hypothetical protein